MYPSKSFAIDTEACKSNLTCRKPKNARAKRAMDKRAPLQHENPKTTLFVAGQKTSQILKLATTDLKTLKKPFIESFTKKNDIHPFEDASCRSRSPQVCDCVLMQYAQFQL